MGVRWKPPVRVGPGTAGISLRPEERAVTILQAGLSTGGAARPVGLSGSGTDRPYR